jgi:hypothetical protein
MKARNLSQGALVFLASAILMSMMLSGCSTSNDQPESSQSLQVSNVTASPSSVEVGATTVIEAVVTDGTNPLPNRVVTFSVPSEYGYCSPSTDTSDENGIVATVFTAIQSGTAVVTVRISEAVYNSVSVSVTSSPQTGSGNVDIAAVPTLLLADGISTSSITVTVRGSEGEVAPDSTVIKLAAGEKFEDIDGNGYFTAGVDTVIYDAIPNGQWDPIGIIPSIAYVEGGNGQAVVNYTAGSDAVTAYIRATVVDAGYEGYGETTLQLTPDASIASISLFCDRIQIAVAGSGGYETANLYATGYDGNGNRVPEGLQISFVITDGPGGGEHLGSVGYGPYVATTNGNGVAMCPISSGSVSGTVRIRAYADTVLSAATQIMVHAGPPADITVGAEVCNTPSFGIINERIEVVAVVSDIYHNPVPDSTAVYFTCDEGTIKAHEQKTVDNEGVAYTWWISGYDDPTADGIVEVIAETNGGQLADTGYFINSWVPAYIWFITDPASGFETFPTTINADGKTMRFFFLEVRDLNMNFVKEQTEIDLESDFLLVASGAVQDGCNASRVKTYMTSVVLEYDYSMNGVSDDGVGAIDNVTANYANVVGTSMPCSLLTGPAYYSGCILDIPATVNYGTTVPITVIIKDRWGNPLGDHTVVVSVAGGGSITNGTQKTNLYGEATGFLFNAPASGPSAPTSVIVSAQDLDPRGNITLTMTVSLTE